MPFVVFFHCSKTHEMQHYFYYFVIKGAPPTSKNHTGIKMAKCYSST